MLVYRCYFLDAEDHIKAAEEIEAVSNSEVIDRALAMLKDRPQHQGIEIWEGTRRLFTSRRDISKISPRHLEPPATLLLSGQG
jgi:hypothetical protein